MTPRRVYIFGASGSGTTTLGAELARRLSVPHIDCDDHYWAPSDPPFSKKRPPQERVRSMKAALGSDGWVITGACHGWGEEIVEDATFLVYVMLDTPSRLSRLEHRQKHRFGERIRPGGDMADIHSGFIAWASQYDDPQFSGRNRAAHEKWLGTQKKSKCFIDGAQPVSDSVTQILAELIQK